MKAEYITVSLDDMDMTVIEKAGEILRRGGLVAFPTETVYGLGGNALDPAASGRIYAAKGRPSDNPLIVHIASLDELPPLVRSIPEQAYLLAGRFWPGPLTMILEKSDAVPYQTTGGLDTVAVRFPSDPVARALIRAAKVPVAAPSANVSGRPSPTTALRVKEDVGDTIDMILDGGPVGLGLESTIVDLTVSPPCVLRPGFITGDMLREVLPDIVTGKAPDGHEMTGAPKAPGMKYRHYAPKAPLTVFAGEREAVVRRICELAGETAARGKKAGILAGADTLARYPAGAAKCAGDRDKDETIARSLYELLREFDEDGVDVIYSESFDTPKLGQAVMNRLLKAAGGRVEHVE